MHCLWNSLHSATNPPSSAQNELSTSSLAALVRRQCSGYHLISASSSNHRVELWASLSSALLRRKQSAHHLVSSHLVLLVVFPKNSKYICVMDDAKWYISVMNAILVSAIKYKRMQYQRIEDIPWDQEHDQYQGFPIQIITQVWNPSSMSRALLMMHANHNDQCYWIYIFLLESAASHLQTQFYITTLSSGIMTIGLVLPCPAKKCWVLQNTIKGRWLEGIFPFLTQNID